MEGEQQQNDPSKVFQQKTIHGIAAVLARKGFRVNFEGREIIVVRSKGETSDLFDAALQRVNEQSPLTSPADLLKLVKLLDTAFTLNVMGCNVGAPGFDRQESSSLQFRTVWEPIKTRLEQLKNSEKENPLFKELFEHFDRLDGEISKFTASAPKAAKHVLPQFKPFK